MAQKETIPNYTKWNIYAGGTAVPDGYTSYEFLHPNGRTNLYIDPIRKGKKVVYQLKSWRLTSSGAWNWHGTVNHPNKAIKIFREMEIK